jgi:hypothetical protein
MLTLAQLGRFITEHHTRDLFRLETLSHYTSDSDGDDLRRYMHGEPAPTAAAKQPWLDRLRADVDAGRAWRVLHAVSHPLSDYVRYECEWGYAYNVAVGQQIRITQLTEPLAQVGDFFVLDHEHVIRSYYGPDFRFVGAEVITDTAPYVALAEVLWRQAEDFRRWWDRHPNDHRDGARVVVDEQARDLPDRIADQDRS